jgi:hypothetical protein
MLMIIQAINFSLYDRCDIPVSMTYYYLPILNVDSNYLELDFIDNWLIIFAELMFKSIFYYV